MSNLFNQAAGATKEAVGNILGNKDLADKGRGQWAEGKGEQKMHEGQARSEEENPNMHRAGDSVKNTGGAAKEKFGQAIGNERMEAEGRSQRAQAKGNAEHHENLAKDNTRSGF
ncbi:hypothetical protein LPJ66_000418 [Kickxella alabastrina]|uniref:Uncharacterized protein n=1 Tax=Kickxella alabastrina TaxID=61397 RepID=A0ACC1IW41_9FUNG|nr:hypothetical protein LPJ66_000418 [Kickxella alabastrina]